MLYFSTELGAKTVLQLEMGGVGDNVGIFLQPLEVDPGRCVVAMAAHCDCSSSSKMGFFRAQLIYILPRQRDRTK